VLVVKITGDEPPNVTVEEFKFIVLVFEFDELICSPDMLYIPLSKVPLLTIRVTDAPRLNALPSVQPPPTPLKSTDPVKLTPLVVTVLPVVVALNVVVPVYVRVKFVA